MLANIDAHCAQLRWVALKLQYCANIGRILSYRPIFIQYVNIVPIFSQYCLLVGLHQLQFLLGLRPGTKVVKVLHRLPRQLAGRFPSQFTAFSASSTWVSALFDVFTWPSSCKSWLHRRYSHSPPSSVGPVLISGLLSPVYTIQPVVKPVWQPVVSCIQPVVKPVVQPGLTTGWTNSGCSFNLVEWRVAVHSTRLSNQFDRLYCVNGYRQTAGRWH